MLYNKTSAVTGTKQSVQQEIENLSVVYSSKNFVAHTQIYGVNPVTGLSFVYTFTFDSDDLEFLKMLNDYGARKAAETLY